MKRFFIFLLVLALIMGTGLYIALNTTIVSRWLITRFIEEKLDNYIVESVVIGQQRYRSPGNLSFQDVQVNLETKGEPARISAASLDLEGLNTLWTDQKKIAISLKGGDVSLSEVGAEDVMFTGTVSFTRGGIKDLQGDMSATRIFSHAYEAGNITSVVSGDDEMLWLKNISAQAYGGKLEGAVTLEYAGGPNYRIEMQLSDLDLQQLEKVNSGVFSQVEGTLDGIIHLEGRPDDVRSLEATLHIPAGGKIKASLLGFIAQYLPQSKEKENLEALLKSGGKLPTEIALLQIKSVNRKTLNGLIKISSRQLNLDLNLPIDINMDGDLNSILKHWQHLADKQSL